MTPFLNLPEERKTSEMDQNFFFRARINFFEIRGREIFLARPGPDRLLPYLLLLLFSPMGQINRAAFPRKL